MRLQRKQGLGREGTDNQTLANLDVQGEQGQRILSVKETMKERSQKVPLGIRTGASLGKEGIFS